MPRDIEKMMQIKATNGRKFRFLLESRGFAAAAKKKKKKLRPCLRRVSLWSPCWRFEVFASTPRLLPVVPLLILGKIPAVTRAKTWEKDASARRGFVRWHADTPTKTPNFRGDPPN
ncbi:LOW QUALITY PROTEIN: hypothetical protein ACHAXS_012743 [Conticribra weissflogii]